MRTRNSIGKNGEIVSYKKFLINFLLAECKDIVGNNKKLLLAELFLILIHLSFNHRYSAHASWARNQT